MLKNRLIPVLFLKNGFLVRSEKFSYHQNLGNPVSQVERFNLWNVDELIYINISETDTYDRGREDTGIDNPESIYDIITMVAKKCFMPLTFGGRIRNVEDIRKRLSLGADKVTINSQAISHPRFITEAAKQFGSQAIIVSIDVRREENGTHRVYTGRGKTKIDKTPWDWAVEAEKKGAGEIFLNSVDRDGMANGYDIELIQKVVNQTTIPVIACGGVGTNKHFVNGLIEGKAAAIAAGNFFNFKELSYVLAKKELKKHNLNVR
jgi:imidazole glycerol-phosphate synthase subunit HisF